ncbi:MAG: Flp family type IVb pilin [Hungatella hathewayi]|nr:Flp family type IVb pilin [Hungatella hathewayi]
MKKFEEMKRWLAEEESGQGMVEYGLIVVLIAVVVITALTSIGTNLKGKFETIASTIAAST